MKSSLLAFLIKGERACAFGSGSLAVHWLSKESNSILYIILTSIIGVILSFFAKPASFKNSLRTSFFSLSLGMVVGSIFFKQYPQLSYWISFLISFIVNVSLNIRYADSNKYTQPTFGTVKCSL